MGTVLIKVKLMPSSPETNLEEIKAKAKEIVEAGEGTKVRFEEEPIAFGLKAVITFFALDESHDVEPIENKLKELENINSAEVIDVRRAFG